MILFLGAGASSPFGIPTTRDFALEIVENITQDPQYQKYSNLLDELRESFGSNFDLEVLLTVLDDLSKDNILEVVSPVTTKFILDKPNPKEIVSKAHYKNSARILFEASVDFIRSKIVLKDKNNKNVILEIYDRLFKIIADKRGGSTTSGDGKSAFPIGLDYVFTTNYDQCLETYFNERRIDYENLIEVRFGLTFLQVDLLHRKTDMPILVKLHGSIDLFKTRDGRIVSLQSPLVKRHDLEKEYFPKGIELEEEVILYPTEAGANRKVIESPFTDFYHHFRVTFQHDPYMIIIGFSLRDRTICSILEQVIVSGRVKNAKIFLVDPLAKRIKINLTEKGYKSLADKIYPISCGIERPEIEKAFREFSF